MVGNEGLSKLFRHRQVEVEGVVIHVVDGGAEQKPAILFLHGWPENWTEFEAIMISLSENYHAYLHAYPGELARAVIMNVAIPGIDPWNEVKRNPYIWHFAFHAIPDLPEKLITGNLSEYFAYFYDAIAAKPGSISEYAKAKYVEAYTRPEALKTGLEWYRSFP